MLEYRGSPLGRRKKSFKKKSPSYKKKKSGRSFGKKKSGRSFKKKSPSYRKKKSGRSFLRRRRTYRGDDGTPELDSENFPEVPETKHMQELDSEDFPEVPETKHMQELDSEDFPVFDSAKPIDRKEVERKILATEELSEDEYRYVVNLENDDDLYYLYLTQKIKMIEKQKSEQGQTGGSDKAESERTTKRQAAGPRMREKERWVSKAWA